MAALLKNSALPRGRMNTIDDDEMVETKPKTVFQVNIKFNSKIMRCFT